MHTHTSQDSLMKLGNEQSTDARIKSRAGIEKSACRMALSEESGKHMPPPLQPCTENDDGEHDDIVV